MVDAQEQKWIDAARAGDQEAFACLVERYEKAGELAAMTEEEAEQAVSGKTK